ncbi:MAG: FHA domain-containing protein [Phycisphaerae bacterium]
MGRDRSRLAGAEPTLPAGAARLRIAAPAGQPTAHVETCQPVTLIGSRRDCDLFIGQDDVSKTHCALVNTGSAIIASDLCSRCGTFVNGQRISAAALHPGDEFHVGSVPVEVRFLDAPAGSATGAACENDADSGLPAPLRLNGAEQEYELAALPAVIGRRHACQVLLDTPDVSLAHALLFTIGGCPAIFDLGSRSGTYLNSERVTLAWLRDGDRLCIGGEELSLVWEGPQFAKCEVSVTEAAGVTDSLDAGDTAAPLQLNSLEDLGSMIEGLKAEISASQARLDERATVLQQRELELEQRSAELEPDRTRLTVEKQQCEQQAAELRAARSDLEQERARFNAQRAQFEHERAQLDTERAELERRLAEYEAMADGLKAREVALDERQATLAAAEQRLARKQAELAEREIANADAAQRIERFNDALTVARRVFASVGTFSEQPGVSGALPIVPAGPARQPDRQEPPATGSPPAGGSLPAPLVDEPLFAGLDAGSPEQWSHELLERLRSLRRESGKSDADVMLQILSEFRAWQSGDRASSGN